MSVHVATEFEVPPLDLSDDIMTSSIRRVRWNLETSQEAEVRTSTPRDVDDSENDATQRSFPEFRPTSPISMITSFSVKSTGNSNSLKRKLTIDSYMDMSGLSLLSAGSSMDESSIDLTPELISTKRKILDQKMQNTLLRNAHFRDRYQQLQEKRLALTSIEEDEPTRNIFLLKQNKSLSRCSSSPCQMSPRRAFHDKKRFEIQRKNSIFRQKYRELQEKRFKLDTALLDTAVPRDLCDVDDSSLTTRPARSSIRLSVSRAVSSPSVRLTSPANRNRTPKRKSPSKHFGVIGQSTSALQTTDSPPPLPPRDKRLNKSCSGSYDVIASIENWGNKTLAVVSRLSDVSNSQSEHVRNQTLSTQCRKQGVVTVRFSYSYQKDGRLHTEF